MNDKRIQRIWREEGLRVPRRTRKRRRVGQTENGSQRLQASRPNGVWSYDFIEDRTADRRRLKILVVVDEYTRECLALEMERRLGSEAVIEVLGRLVTERGAPGHVRSDNGPEFVAKAVQRWLAARGIQTLDITPGSPWENAYCESFKSRFHDEFLNLEVLTSVVEAKVLSAVWRRDYNEARPHSALGDQSPAEFASRWRATVGATPLPTLASAITPDPQPNLS